MYLASYLRLSFTIFLLSFAIQLSFGQTFTIKGKVIDAATAEGIPFANVYPKNNVNAGKTTDFDGYFELKLKTLEDSLVVSYIGYKKKVKALRLAQKEGNIYILNFQLAGESTKLEEIVFKSKEDPAYPIMRKVLKNKKYNDTRKLEEYEYESYSKTEFDLNNISDKFSRKKIVRKVRAAIDSSGGLTGEDGKPLIPLFMAETISKFYYRKNPERKKEEIIKTKVDGVGFGDGDAVSQLLGSSFQQYNFYRNWLRIFEKDFVSPIADGWRLYYDYYLEDSMYVGKDWCYKIEVIPKRVQDLAFEGRIWIDSKTYALKQIDAKVGKKANINFIEKVKIQQELNKTEAGPWFPKKTRVLIDVAELTDSSAGILAKFYISNKDIVVNKKYPIKFYKEPLIIKANARKFEEGYWASKRHDSLSVSDIQTYKLLDTIRQVPIVKNYSEILNILARGYKTYGPIDIGNIVYTYAFNNVEGHRLRFGMRTNVDFSTKVEFKGYAAYGTKDGKFKYSGRFRYIPFRKNWTEIAIERSEDIVQGAATPDGVSIPGAFIASLNFFDVKSRSPFWRVANTAYIQSDIFKGFRQTIKFRNFNYQPIGNHFGYFEDPQASELVLKDNFTTSELILETRLSKQERFFYIGNNRFSMRTRKLPIVTLRYTMGLKGFWNGDFSYHKFDINLEQQLRLGVFGRTYYSLTGTYTPSRLPYPLLDVPLGNAGFIYNFYGFGLMNFLEFVNDRSVMFNFEHDFAGFIFNRFPLLKKLNWRAFAVANILYGDLRDENKNLTPATDAQGNLLSQPLGLTDKPYIELGYGIGNIFRFFRVTFLHRINYLNRPDVRNFGVFVSARFQL